MCSSLTALVRIERVLSFWDWVDVVRTYHPLTGIITCRRTHRLLGMVSASKNGIDPNYSLTIFYLRHFFTSTSDLLLNSDFFAVVEFKGDVAPSL
jgi:hypothetical protein